MGADSLLGRLSKEARVTVRGKSTLKQKPILWCDSKAIVLRNKDSIPLGYHEKHAGGFQELTIQKNGRHLSSSSYGHWLRVVPVTLTILCFWVEIFQGNGTSKKTDLCSNPGFFIFKLRLFLLLSILEMYTHFFHLLF